MTGWLLDTNVVSQLAPAKDGRPKVEHRLSEWIVRNTDTLFLSAITVVEVVAGIQKLRRAGGSLRASDLQTWFDRIVALHGERILPVDAEVGKVAGLLADQARAKGRNPGLSDILIAATAQAHGRGLMTNNTKHFEPLGLNVPLLDPFQQALPDQR